MNVINPEGVLSVFFGTAYRSLIKWTDASTKNSFSKILFTLGEQEILEKAKRKSNRDFFSIVFQFCRELSKKSSSTDVPLVAFEHLIVTLKRFHPKAYQAVAAFLSTPACQNLALHFLDTLPDVMTLYQVEYGHGGFLNLSLLRRSLGKAERVAIIQKHRDSFQTLLQAFSTGYFDRILTPVESFRCCDSAPANDSPVPIPLSMQFA